MEFLMSRETESAVVYLIIRGLFIVCLVFWVFYIGLQRRGKIVVGIRFLLFSPMLFGVSGMLARVR